MGGGAGVASQQNEGRKRQRDRRQQTWLRGAAPAHYEQCLLRMRYKHCLLLLRTKRGAY